MLSMTLDLDAFAARRRKVQDRALEAIRPLVAASPPPKWTGDLNEAILLLFAEVYEDETGEPWNRDTKAWFSRVIEHYQTADESADERATALMLVTATINAATMQAALDDEEELLVEWVSMSDGAVRETHQEAHGQVRPVGEMFEVGEARMPHPGFPVPQIEEWLNCRCVVRPTKAGEFVSSGNTTMAPTAQEREEKPTMPGTDGKYPIGNCDDLRKAIGLVGNSTEDTEKVKTWIRSSKKRLGCPDVELPSTWIARREVFKLVSLSISAAATPEQPLDEPTHAGLVVIARDTGRILMIQRSLDQDDPPEVQGTWEFPGGTIEEGETPQEAAEREFCEETGLPVPDGEIVNGWRSPNGVYQGFVLAVPVEADAFEELNPDLAAAERVNPDDPERRNPDVSAWFTIQQVQNLGPALRPECRDTDWSLFDIDQQEDEMPEKETLVAAAGGGEPIPWYGVWTKEGVWTGDKRRFRQGSLSHRQLPLPFTWQKVADDGHKGNVTIGHATHGMIAEPGIDLGDGTVTEGEEFLAAGTFFESVPETDEAIGLLAEAGRFGVSVDADDTTFEMDEEAGGIEFTQARISSACMLPIPAFAEAWVTLGKAPWLDEAEEAPDEEKRPEGTEVPEEDMIRDDAPPPPEDDDEEKKKVAAAMERLHVSDRPEDVPLTTTNGDPVEFVDVAPGKTEDGPGWLTHPIDTDRLRDYWVRGPGAAKIGWGTPGDFNRCRAAVAEYVKPQHLNGYCFTGDTEFLTRDGVNTFEETVGTRQMVLTHKAPMGSGEAVSKAGYWVEAPIEPFGEQPVLSVTLRRGKTRKVIRATAEHEWFVSTDARSAARKHTRQVTTADLRPGMAMASLMPMPVAKRRSEPSGVGIMAGVVYGDGTRDSLGASVDLWGEKDANLLPYFEVCHSMPIKHGDLLGRRVKGLPASFKSLPSLDEGFSYLMGWLAGYIAADGTVNHNGAVMLQSADRDSLEFAAVVANRLGISTLPIRERVRSGFGRPETALYTLGFVGETFPESMLLIPEHRIKFHEPKFTATRWVVEAVEDKGEVEQVYCAVVPETETFALADYIWTHNCANRHYDALGFWPGRPVAGDTTSFASDTEVPAMSLVAAGGFCAPSEWFEDPKFTEVTPLRVTEEGRVFGHVAAWEQCHLNSVLNGDVCVAPPHSQTDYSFFLNSGVVHLDNGTEAAVGQISVGGGHARDGLSIRAALAHYDSTSTAVADVTCGEDEHGIWVAGWIRPGTSDEMITTLRASDVSPDWREVRGNLEMIALLAVNVGGFSLPRPRVATRDGRQVSLVASGIVERDHDEEPAASEESIDYEALAGRVAQELAAMQQRKAEIAALAAEVG